MYGAPTARRQDAQRNRAAIVRAAAEVLAASEPAAGGGSAGGGSAVPMPEIARRAGVGLATLYRHFPDRSALATAVIAHHLQRLEACAASEACRPAMFRELLRGVLHTQVEMRSLALRLDAGARDKFQKRLLAACGEPLRRAQRQGYVRGDVTPADLLLLFAMVRGVAEATGDPAEARAAADRSIDLLLDGVFRVGAP